MSFMCFRRMTRRRAERVGDRPGRPAAQTSANGCSIFAAPLECLAVNRRAIRLRCSGCRHGRRLRDAQTELSHAGARLAQQRRHLIGELLDQAQAHAAEADLLPPLPCC